MNTYRIIRIAVCLLAFLNSIIDRKQLDCMHSRLSSPIGNLFEVTKITYSLTAFRAKREERNHEASHFPMGSSQSYLTIGKGNNPFGIKDRELRFRTLPVWTFFPLNCLVLPYYNIFILERQTKSVATNRKKPFLLLRRHHRQGSFHIPIAQSRLVTYKCNPFSLSKLRSLNAEKIGFREERHRSFRQFVLS